MLKLWFLTIQVALMDFLRASEACGWRIWKFLDFFLHCTFPQTSTAFTELVQPVGKDGKLHRITRKLHEKPKTAGKFVSSSLITSWDGFSGRCWGYFFTVPHGARLSARFSRTGDARRRPTLRTHQFVSLSLILSFPPPTHNAYNSITVRKGATSEISPYL